MSGRHYRRTGKRDGDRTRGPRKLSDVIADVISRRGYARTMTDSVYMSAWQLATDDILSAASRPGDVRKGVLNITVKNSSVMQELTFQKKKILKVLNQQITDQAIVDLRFRVGNID